MIDPDAKAAVTPELMPGERLLWAGRPQGRVWTFMGMWLVGFSLFWLALTLPMLLGVVFGMEDTTDGEEIVFAARIVAALFVLAFPAAGVFMLVNGIKHLLGPARERYAVTDRRGLIVSPFMGYRVASLSPDALMNSERSGKPNRGSLSFGGRGGMFGTFYANPWKPPLDTFRKIDDPARVQALIHQTFAPTGTTP